MLNSSLKGYLGKENDYFLKRHTSTETKKKKKIILNSGLRSDQVQWKEEVHIQGSSIYQKKQKKIKTLLATFRLREKKKKTFSINVS